MSARKALRRKDKMIVARMSEHLRKKSEKGDQSYIDKTVELAGVSRRTVFRIRKELRETGELSSPSRPQRGAYKPIDSFDDEVIRNKVRAFYDVRKQLPTLRTLLATLKEDISYPGNKDHLRGTLRRLGFSWKRTVDNRKILTEKPHVVQQRFSYFSRKEHLEESGFQMVYVDETWIDTAYTVKKCWQAEGISGVKKPCNRGQRLIVVHAGCSDGFIEGALLIYKSSSNTGDYHKEMNGTNFTKWVQEKRIPNLKTKSAIVLDNASYHSAKIDKCPTTNSRKGEIQEWLRKQGLQFDEKMVKARLLEIVRLNKPDPTYEIDAIIRQHGHEVLRLPPYHPDLNPIELIWGQIKTIVRQQNLIFSLDDVRKKTNEAFEEVGKARWTAAITHVETLLEKMKTRDNYQSDRTTGKVLISLDDSTDSDNSSTDTASEAE